MTTINRLQFREINRKLIADWFLLVVSLPFFAAGYVVGLFWRMVRWLSAAFVVGFYAANPRGQGET